MPGDNGGSGYPSPTPTNPSIPPQGKTDGDSYDFSFGYGGSLFIISAEADTKNPVETKFSIHSPQTEGGFKFIWSKDTSGPPPLNISIGTSFLGFTFAHNFSSFSVNLGISGGLSPLNMSGEIATINWGEN